MSTVEKVWFNRLPQYMVPSMHYFPELVNAAIKHFNPSTNTIEGQTLLVNIGPTTIWNMLCIPDPMQRGMIVEKFTPKQGNDIWSTRDKALEFYNEESQMIEAEQEKPLRILVPHGAFKEDLRDAFSMMAFIFGLDTDQEVQNFQLGSDFQF